MYGKVFIEFLLMCSYYVNMKILVTGAGGFIAGHLIKRLIAENHQVVAADIKPIEDWYQVHPIKNLERADCKDRSLVKNILIEDSFDRIYNLACNMGGMGFIQQNHIACLESVYIQTNFITLMKELKIKPQIFYSSSACAYPQHVQQEIDAAALKEQDVIPANPEDGYGWEKIFSEIITQYGVKEENFDARIGRFHNCYGPEGTWQGGREKAPAALCRKVIEAKKSGVLEIDVWGDGEQTRSFMYVDDCVEGIYRLWESDYKDPVNLGSSEMVSVNQMIDMIEEIAQVKVKRNYQLDKPQGVRGRNSDNTLIKKITGGWEPSIKLKDGLEKTYNWIEKQIG